MEQLEQKVENSEVLSLDDVRPGWGTVRAIYKILKGDFQDPNEYVGDERILKE